MADNLAAGAAAAVAIADAGGLIGNKARLSLRPFEGKNDARTTRDFCLKADGYQAVARLTAVETAQAVAFAMVPGSAADLWLANLIEEVPADARDWTRLRPLLMARFSPDLTASERAAMVDHCKQAKNEDVQAFLDQCKATQLLLDRNVPDAEKLTDPYKERFKQSVLELFLRGLREEGGLKSHVNGALGCTTLAQYKDAAVRYERHISKQVKVVVAELATDDDQEDADDHDEVAEVANLKAKGGQKKKNRGGGKSNNFNANPGRGSGRQGNSYRGGGSGGGGPPRPRLCWTCRSADHLNAQCPNNPNKKGGGGKGGGYRGGGSGGGGRGNSQVDAAVYQLGLDALMSRGTNRANVETLDGPEARPPPPQYSGGYNHPGFY